MSIHDADEADRKARTLDRLARHHKRQARNHREAARKAREDLEALKRDCARLGIELKFQPGEGVIHGQGTHSRP
ncbi:hypothetical protein [Rhizobium arsenicireducens]